MISLDIGFSGGTSSENALIETTRRILTAMYSGDAQSYSRLCAADLSSIEPSIAPYRIDGLAFHLDLIHNRANGSPTRLDVLTPRVAVYGDTGVVCYTLLKTYLPDAGTPTFERVNETRVFHKEGENWIMVHLHKSPAG